MQVRVGDESSRSEGKSHLAKTAEPHGGSLRAKAPPTRCQRPSPTRAPSVQNAAGGFRPSAEPHGGSLRANRTLQVPCTGRQR